MGGSHGCERARLTCLVQYTNIIEAGRGAECLFQRITELSRQTKPKTVQGVTMRPIFTYLAGLLVVSHGARFVRAPHFFLVEEKRSDRGRIVRPKNTQNDQTTKVWVFNACLFRGIFLTRIGGSRGLAC